MLYVKIKKLSEKAIIPSYSKIGDAGLDLVATSIVSDYNFIEYGTSIAIEIPEGYVGFIYPRSSISKYGLSLCNSVGVVDSGYRGEILLRFKRINFFGVDNQPCIYSVGDRIGQLIIIPYPEVKFEEVMELPNTIRGNLGFGSTGA